MKNIAFIILFITSIAYSQTKKTIVPTTGAIVFKMEAIISDTIKYQKSYDRLSSMMIDYQIEKENANTFVNIDTSKVNQIKKTFKSILHREIKNKILNKDAESFKYHQKFHNNLIINYITSNDKIISDISIINPKLKLLKIVASDSISIISENKNYSYNKNEIVEIKEFKKEKRIIKGYTCFKVVVSYKEFQQNDIDFNNFMHQNYIQKRELWVTTQIKCNYHPVINEKEILLKYYPLEIIESTENIEGFVTKYLIEKIDIK
ncbi:MAG: hypothetical protein HC854_10520 [Flavobacterium sp.]|nr:hypothetical protein [Flavobacterium sp.]